MVERVVEGGDLLTGQGGEVGLPLPSGLVLLPPPPAERSERVGAGHGGVVGRGGLLGAPGCPPDCRRRLRPDGGRRRGRRERRWAARAAPPPTPWAPVARAA